ncbi:MAG: fatty acid desaturase [Bacteroidetes bacterium]|nr:MAG: fatty acid desaturase [Bacteroidota bacterium]
MKTGSKPDTSKYKLSAFQQAVELCRPWFLLGVYIVLAYFEYWWLAIPMAVAVCFAGFIQTHDAIHSSLGLSKKANAVFLSLSSLLILKSGHGSKVTHLRHHGQCLGDHDPEGAPAKWTLKEVFLNGPYHVFTMRFAQLKMSPNTRGIQLFETAVTFLLLVGFVALYYFTGSLTGLVYWGAAFILSCLMPLWASYIPHKIAPRNPARLAGVKLSRFWTPVISSFAYHHFHHAYPKIPTALLPKAARELPEVEEHEHEHNH